LSCGIVFVGVAILAPGKDDFFHREGKRKPRPTGGALR
jgi:hypothetical protein